MTPITHEPLRKKESRSLSASQIPQYEEKIEQSKHIVSSMLGLVQKFHKRED
jgi:hypothetical protein